jgi:uncharacterized damage-inducible protein DinB
MTPHSPASDRPDRERDQMLKEMENYLQRLDDLHKQVLEVISGVPSDGLNFEPIHLPQLQVSNSLAELTAHIAGAEHFWIGEVIAKMPPTRDRDAEFKTKVRGSNDLVAKINTVSGETHAILAALNPADLDSEREVDERLVPVRWAILHVIDHTALHLGHMQLTYQIWARGDSKPSPTWFSRLPPR